MSFYESLLWIDVDTLTLPVFPLQDWSSWSGRFSVTTGSKGETSRRCAGGRARSTRGRCLAERRREAGRPRRRGSSRRGGLSVAFGGPGFLVSLSDAVNPRPLVGLVVNCEERGGAFVQRLMRKRWKHFAKLLWDFVLTVSSVLALALALRWFHCSDKHTCLLKLSSWLHVMVNLPINYYDMFVVWKMSSLSWATKYLDI